MVAITPTIRTSSGTNSLQRPARSGFTEKKLNSMKAVALVGPMIVWREDEKSGATSAATAGAQHSIHHRQPGDGRKGDRLGNRQQRDVRGRAQVVPQLVRVVAPERRDERKQSHVFRGEMIPDSPCRP